MTSKGKAELPAELSSRFTFQAHDFFKLNPIERADVYLLRLILHEWPDEDAVKILQNIAPRMAPNTRILINDSVVPPPGTMSPLQEKYIRNSDMIMMSMFNALERTLEDWQCLIEKADPQLKMINVTTLDGGTLSLIEVMRL